MLLSRFDLVIVNPSRCKCQLFVWRSLCSLTRSPSPPTPIMSYFLPHLPSGWHVDEAIKSEEDRIVVIRFGHDWDSQCMTMDETLYSVAEKVQNFAVIYLVDITEVPDFNKVRVTCGLALCIV